MNIMSFEQKIKQGQAAFAGGQFKEAEDFFRQAAKLKAESPVAYYWLGEALKRQSKNDDALKAYELSLKYNPLNVLTTIKKAYLIQNTGGEKVDWNYLLTYVTKVMETEKTGENYYARGLIHGYLDNTKAAKEDFEEAFKLVGDVYSDLQVNLGYIYLRLARSYHTLSKFDEALDYYTKAITVGTKDIGAFYNRAVLYYTSKKTKEAINDFEKAMELDVKRALNYGDLGHYLGNCYLLEKQYDNAIKYFKISMEHKKTDFSVCQALAVLYREKSQLKDAIETYSTYIAHNPKNADAFFERSIFYAELKDEQNALKDCQKALELNPDHPEACRVLKGYEAFVTQSPELLTMGTEFIQLNPTRADGYVARALIYDMFKFSDATLQDLNKAIELDKENPQHYLQRAFVFLKKSELRSPQNAIPDLKKAIELKTENIPLVHAVLGECYFELKQYDNAFKNFELAEQHASKSKSPIEKQFFTGIGQWLEKTKYFVEENPEWFLVRALFFLEAKDQKEHQKAIPYLEKAIELKTTATHFCYARLDELYLQGKEAAEAIKKANRGITTMNMFRTQGGNTVRIVHSIEEALDALDADRNGPTGPCNIL